MEDQERYSKLEITGFTNTEIKPAPRVERTITVNAAPGWYTKTFGKAVDSAKGVRKKMSIRKKNDGKNDDEKTIRGLLVKTAICACIALTLLLIKNLNTPFTNTITNEVRSVVSSQNDLDKEIGRLKFVQNLFGSEPVLSEITNTDYVYPVEGKVVKKFGADGSTGITVEATKNGTVVSAITGEIKSVKNDASGDIVSMQGKDGTQIVYSGIVSKVKSGDAIKMGGVLGTLKSDTLIMQVFQNGKAIDPQKFLSKSGIQKE